SFVDDPTRILRAVRYEKRFHFRIEPRTLSALKMACQEDAFVSITPVRYFNDFKRILQEADPVPPLRRLRFVDGLRYFTFGALEEKLLDKIVKSQCTTSDFHKEGCEDWIPRLAGLLALLDQRRAEELLTLFNVSRHERQNIMQFLHFLHVPDMLVRLRQKSAKTSLGKRSL
ncbi:MAG: hypothetical protein HQL18_04695, partial [Candidatus Omnitrophica bacterium]|nr:hypothetical protein [Candidatus Omnitrophota bacterium]